VADDRLEEPLAADGERGDRDVDGTVGAVGAHRLAVGHERLGCSVAGRGERRVAAARLLVEEVEIGPGTEARCAVAEEPLGPYVRRDHETGLGVGEENRVAGALEEREITVARGLAVRTDAARRRVELARHGEQRRLDAPRQQAALAPGPELA